MATLGTYLPPLFTKASAEMTASNAIHLQREMDARFLDSTQAPPLLLLETPPLTYFSVGDLAYSDFFLTHGAGAMRLSFGHRACVDGVSIFWPMA
ncbi:MAG: hypothetical protein O2999_07195 [Nitrospirae bacterium]|nr:hypothetical protein [Nitrospirota bacterium]